MAHVLCIVLSQSHMPTGGNKRRAVHATQHGDHGNREPRVSAESPKKKSRKRKVRDRSHDIDNDHDDVGAVTSNDVGDVGTDANGHVSADGMDANGGFASP